MHLQTYLSIIPVARFDHVSNIENFNEKLDSRLKRCGSETGHISEMKNPNPATTLVRIVTVSRESGMRATHGGQIKIGWLRAQKL